MALCMLTCSTILADNTRAINATLQTDNSYLHDDDSSNSSSTVDYSSFSKMLAGVLVLREGGIANATLALPHLNAVTQQYLDTQVGPQATSSELYDIESF